MVAGVIRKGCGYLCVNSIGRNIDRLGLASKRIHGLLTVSRDNRSVFYHSLLPCSSGRL